MKKIDTKVLRTLANRNVIGLLNRLGVPYDQRGPQLKGACLCKQHGGDGTNPTAFNWRSDYGRWICFTHHCELVYGNDIFGLVRSILGLTFHEAVEWIDKALTSGDLDDEETVVSDSPKEPSLHLHEPIVEDRLKFLKSDVSYLVGRGFDPVILAKYQVGTWQRLGTYMHNRIIFPVRDHESHLVGFTGRTLVSEEERANKKVIKWLHGRDYALFPKVSDFFVTSLLFNWHNAKKHLGEGKELIVVEGPLDGMRLEEAGIYNWVATLGTTFTPVQRSLLIDAGVNKIWCAYDADELHDGRRPGDSGWMRMKQIVGNLIELERVELPEGKDPGSMSVQEVLQVFTHETEKH